MDQNQLNYARIEQAIAYCRENFTAQPSLAQIARVVNLSPSHFQRLFSDWAGVSPKKFLQFLSIEYAKSLLQHSEVTLLATAHKTGLSGTSRLHDLFINIEGMTPCEFKNGGQNLMIHYSFGNSPFGEILQASTNKGLCHMEFAQTRPQALTRLTQRFPNAMYKHRVDTLQQDALNIFQNDWSQLNTIKLHLKASVFQLKVWHCLLKIPKGQLTTYGAIAKGIGNPKASRAVGSAIGANPISFLIPCHRVIQSSGRIGGFMWGPNRKSAMIGWEAAQEFTAQKLL